MSKNESNRVLNRIGAREVTQEEMEQVAAAAGPKHTLACTIPTSYKSGSSTTCDIEQ